MASAKLLNISLFVFLNCLYSLITCGQPLGIDWQKSYGGSDGDNLSIRKIDSSSIYLLGGTLSNNGDVNCNHGDNDGWLLKIKSNNFIDTSRCFGGTVSDGVDKIEFMGINNCLILGSTHSNDGDVSGVHGEFDLWIFKVQSSTTSSGQGAPVN